MTCQFSTSPTAPPLVLPPSSGGSSNRRIGISPTYRIPRPSSSTRPVNPSSDVSIRAIAGTQRQHVFQFVSYDDCPLETGSLPSVFFGLRAWLAREGRLLWWASVPLQSCAYGVSRQGGGTKGKNTYRPPLSALHVQIPC